MASHRVEPATTDDARDIATVARESWHAAYDDILGEATVEEIVDDWYAVAALREQIADEAQCFRVARADRVLDGFAHAGPHAEKDCWALFRIYVAPQRWGEGVGTDLLDAVEAAIRARGASVYELGVLAQNEIGVGFYESRSFERVDTSTVELAGVETIEYTYRKPL